MENTESWNRFARTGSVSDYLNYVNKSSSDNDRCYEEANKGKERGQRERTSDGNGTFSSYHW